MTQILVIEDEPDLRELVEEILVSAGFEAIVADNGLEGVRLATEHKPDLIISDIRMPELSGYQVLERIRQNSDLVDIPFIFLTSSADLKSQRLGMNLGADDFLAKPFDKVELLAAVNARLQKRLVIERRSQAKGEAELNALRQNIALSLPHELRTPLVGIIGLADLLTETYESVLPEEILEYAQDIRASADRLYALIQNYLTYADFELNKEALKAEANAGEDCLFWLAMVRDIAQHLAKKHNRLADLSWGEIVEANLEIKEVRLYKILSELTDNAFKFSAPGSPIEISSFLDSKQLAIQISDCGRGFSADQIANIGAYTQFNRKVYEQQGGGLGLALAKHLIELYGGSLEIISELDKYTQVTVRLPLADRSTY
jgi:two-component system, sensor histidine kinase and response regulator